MTCSLALARRDALILLAAIVTLVDEGCAASRSPPKPPSAPAEPLRLDPLVDLVPAAGLRWLVEARPAPWFHDPALAEAVGLLVPPDFLARFAVRSGGVDLREADQIVVAGMEGSIVALARVAVDGASVEAALERRGFAVEGRASEHGVARFWGTVGGEPQQAALFGREAVGIETGRFGALEAATYFALGRLRRSLPALRADPLAAVAARVGPAPLRGFAPGPFEGDWAKGLGGLLRATTAAGLGVRPAAGGDRAAAVALRLVLTGGWGGWGDRRDDGRAAARLEAAFGALADDALGRLMGLDRPVQPAGVRQDAAALQLDVALDAAELARGISAATSRSLSEIMAF